MVGASSPKKYTHEKYISPGSSTSSSSPSSSFNSNLNSSPNSISNSSPNPIPKFIISNTSKSFLPNSSNNHISSTLLFVVVSSPKSIFNRLSPISLINSFKSLIGLTYII